jgi:hypothetical protein
VKDRGVYFNAFLCQLRHLLYDAEQISLKSTHLSVTADDKSATTDGKRYICDSRATQVEVLQAAIIHESANDEAFQLIDAIDRRLAVTGERRSEYS